jgi:hypothetical protein
MVSPMDGETPLEMVTRHIWEGEAAISRQRALVTRLSALGQSTVVAEELLVQFMATQMEHVAHLKRLMAQR